MTQDYYYCFEQSLILNNLEQDTLIAGVDEVGRGALFGSVVAAAVVLPLSVITQLRQLGIKDSKKLSAKKRQQLAELIPQIVTDWQIGEATVTEIDRFNILQASLLAMKRAVTKLKTTPHLCLVDGKFTIPNIAITQQTLIKGDQQSFAIAASSILAKVWRDNLILDLAKDYPEYDLNNNKGYPTIKHKLAIQKYGISDLHRRSFKTSV